MGILSGRAPPLWTHVGTVLREWEEAVSGARGEARVAAYLLAEGDAVAPVPDSSHQ
jgi:hypothetical protein